MRKMMLVFFTAAFAYVASGCGTLFLGAGPHARWPYYAIGFANRTPELLSDVRSEWVANGVKYSPSAGFLGTNSTKEDSEAPDPIPDSATVIWKNPRWQGTSSDADRREENQKHFDLDWDGLVQIHG